ncbi:MAG: hypothetical protein ACRECR_04570 [Thermoplasmata archaeon]
MAKRRAAPRFGHSRKKGRRASVHSTSVLTALFAAAPALFVLTANSTGTSPLGALLGGGGSWQSIQGAGWALAGNVSQNWVTLLIMVAVVWVVVTVVRKAGRGARITKHLRL